VTNVIIDCECGTRQNIIIRPTKNLTEYTPPPDAPMAILQDQSHLMIDCPDCGAHHVVPIPARELFG